ncbi:MAG: hypothetical protein CMJ20_09835 [Phycisphaeraceae bacterium]|nr:hypothetical protein [Phycisphaeraceae bacterium]|tara:strand:- start:2969 stop:4306 length:1338 start_codon:yes stop_codon:yes gene_type:complete
MPLNDTWVTPNDPDYGKQWGLEMVRAEEAWKIEKGSPEIVVAVIEGGFDLHHPDLEGQCLEPYDATGGYERSGKKTPRDHGSHVCGIIAAKGNNGIGIVGLAPQCRLLPILMGASNDEASLAGGIRHAVKAGARVINLSAACYFNPIKVHGQRPERTIHKKMWTPPPSEELLEAIYEADQAGVVLACTVSNNENNNSIHWPSAVDVMLRVTAVNRDGKKSNFACFGDGVEVAAPAGQRSVPYPSDVKDDMGIYSTIGNAGYRYWAGTCQAVPHVSALAALIFSRHPEFTSEEVRQIIRNTANGYGWNPYLGHGVIDAGKALAYDEPVPDLAISPEDISVNYENACYRDPGATVTVNVNVRNDGPIDSGKVLVALYEGIPDDGGYMLGYYYVKVRGLEATAVEFHAGLDAGEHTLSVLVDPFGKLPASKRSRGEIYAKAYTKCVIE